MLNDLHALVLDPDATAAGRIAQLLEHGFRIATRTTPEDALEYVGRAKPDVVLLGVPFWRDGWASEILAASPDTVVVPVLDIPGGRPEESAA